MPFVLLQTADAETITVDLEMTAGTPEERTAEVLSRLSERAMALPEVAKG